MALSRRGLMLGAGTLPLLARRAEAANDTLRFGLSAYPPNLQPWVSTGQAAATVKLQLYRGLLSFGPDGKLRPELAESWGRDGEAGWVFRLRDAIFQSGAPVTSADVAWTLDQVRAEKSTAYLAGQLRGIKSIETPDARTVRIVMQEPTVTVPLWMASSQMPIIERRSMENGGTPVGAGPYTIASQERGVAIELAAWDKFYKPGLPKTRRIRFVVYADENLRMAALNAGDVDLIEYVPWQSMGEVEKNPKLRLDGSVGPFMNLLFNGKTGPFKDARVRQAAAYAIKRDDIVQAAFFGRGSPLGGMPIAPGTDYYDAGLANVWTYDPDRAKALLKEAGMANGFSCTILATAQYGMHKTTAEVVQQHLAAIGVQATLNLPEWGQRVTLGNRGQYEIAVFGTSTDNNDPDGMQTVLDGELPMTYGRSAFMPTPKIHDLFAAGRREFDDAKRHAIYAELQKQALADAPMVTLCWRTQAYAMTTSVQGFASLPGALSYNSGITLETTALS
jgi:peptide/nickel transport system substrate-binding protein